MYIKHAFGVHKLPKDTAEKNNLSWRTHKRVHRAAAIHNRWQPIAHYSWWRSQARATSSRPHIRRARRRGWWPRIWWRICAGANEIHGVT